MAAAEADEARSVSAEANAAASVAAVSSVFVIMIGSLHPNKSVSWHGRKGPVSSSPRRAGRAGPTPSSSRFREPLSHQGYVG